MTSLTDSIKKALDKAILPILDKMWEASHYDFQLMKDDTSTRQNHTSNALKLITKTVLELTRRREITIDGKTFITAKEASEILEMSQEHLGARRSQKLTPSFIKIGTKVLYDMDDVQELLKSRVHKYKALSAKKEDILSKLKNIDERIARMESKEK